VGSVMKITITVEDENEVRTLTKDYGEAWDFDVYVACDYFREAMTVMGFGYIDNVTMHSEGKEWSCRF
jgi:hypothetical protein